MLQRKFVLDYLGTGSLEDVQDEIFSVLQPHHMKGYVFVEASAKHHVEKVIGRTGMSTILMKNCRKVLDGESPLKPSCPILSRKQPQPVSRKAVL